jgi:hypothetical protein
MKKTNSDKIVKLTDKWYYYVNLDHHKNKDCIWNIEISYKYGDEPKYFAYHNGYIIDDWASPNCDTLEDAELWLINKLERELEIAREHLEEILLLPEDSEEKSWVDPSGKAKQVLEYLND